MINLEQLLIIKQLLNEVDTENNERRRFVVNAIIIYRPTFFEPKAYTKGSKFLPIQCRLEANFFLFVYDSLRKMFCKRLLTCLYFFLSVISIFLHRFRVAKRLNHFVCAFNFRALFASITDRAGAW